LLRVVAEHAVRDTKKLTLRTAVLMSKSSEIVRDTARTASGLRKHDKTYETYATPDSDVEELRMLKEEKKSSALISLASSARRNQSVGRYGGAPVAVQNPQPFRGRGGPPANRGGRGNNSRGRG
jgi:hypothetical protein